MPALTDRKELVQIRKSNRHKQLIVFVILLCAFTVSAFGQNLDVTIIQRQYNETGHSGYVPGHIYSTANVSKNSVTASQVNLPAHKVEYSVTGATFSLLLPDNRVVIVNCVSKYAMKGDYVNRRSCRMPIVDNINAEFKGSDAKLKWPVSLDGKKTESETYKILGIFDYAPDVDIP